VIIQHDLRDIGKLPAFPAAAKESPFPGTRAAGGRKPTWATGLPVAVSSMEGFDAFSPPSIGWPTTGPRDRSSS